MDAVLASLRVPRPQRSTEDLERMWKALSTCKFFQAFSVDRDAQLECCRLMSYLASTEGNLLSTDKKAYLVVSGSVENAEATLGPSSYVTAGEVKCLSQCEFAELNKARLQLLVTAFVLFSWRFLVFLTVSWLLWLVSAF